MKAIIVKNIELKTMEVPDSNGPTIRERVEDASVMLSTDPTVEEFQDVQYHHVKVLNQDREPLNYFVKMDDKDVFQDLVAVNTYTLQRLERTAVDNWKFENLDRIIGKEVAKAKEKVRDLPWYARLLKLF